MSELKRIDPEAVPGMFQKAGLKPVNHAFFTPDRSGCCVNSILVVESTGDADAAADALRRGIFNRIVVVRDFIDLPWRYINGLMEGWDGVRSPHNSSPAYVAGLEDGQAAWIACEQEGLC